MKAIIMAGGKGSRLRPLTDQIPKPMVNVIDKPVLQCIIELLRSYGITEIALTLGYRAEVITDYFGDGGKLDVNLRYYTEKAPLGTAGSVKNAADFIDGSFLVMSGDAYTNVNLNSLIRFHKTHGGVGTLAGKYYGDARGFGLVRVASDGQILSFKEKPTEKCAGIINTGIYVFEKDILQYIKSGFCDFALDVFPLLTGKLYCKQIRAYWSDIGTLSSYYLTNHYVAKQMAKAQTV